MTHDAEDRQLAELLAPLAELTPLRPLAAEARPRRRRLVRPVLAAAAALAVAVAAGGAIVLTGRSEDGQVAASTVAPAETVAAWFLRDGHPVGVEVAVPADVDPLTARLQALLAGPPPGLESAIAPGTALGAVSLADGIATVELAPAPTEGLASEQLVATLVGAPGVRWVRIGDAPGLLDRTLAAGGVDTAPPIELVRAVVDDGGVTFAGTADTFEANVQVRLVQAGREVAASFVTATCGTGCRGSFEGRIETGRATAGPATLELFTRSAEDGSVRDLVRRDVVLP